MRAAVIDDMGKVINIILVNDLSYSPGDGLTLVESETANIGDTYNAGAFIPAPVSLPVPQEITRRQARLALLFAGLLDSVDAVIDSIPDPMARAVAKIEWNEALTIDRASPLITELAPALGLTEADVDNLFITGAGL